MLVVLSNLQLMTKCCMSGGGGGGGGVVCVGNK